MKANYYAIIPANVRYSNIKANSKLLYGEISALSNKHGYCFATNRYFSELYNVNKNTISLWIKDLSDNKFIDVYIERDESKQVIQRRLSIAKIADTPITKKDDSPITKNGEYNTTSINTTSKNTIVFRKEKFLFEVKNKYVGILDDKQVIEFIEYWCESNEKRMRFEMEKTWDMNLRMKRWSRNQWTKKENKQETKTQSQFSSYSKAMDIVKNMKL
tara:strand:+ start:2761 stop:3408 length:648 start_codon:yes stop_codon:yes gene_type:complete